MRSDTADLRRQWAAIKERHSVFSHQLERMKGQRIGQGLIVPTQGQSVGPDGCVSVKWENGTVGRYFRTGADG